MSPQDGLSEEIPFRMSGRLEESFFPLLAIQLKINVGFAVRNRYRLKCRTDVADDRLINNWPNDLIEIFILDHEPGKFGCKLS